MTSHIYDLIIIGSGPAGLAAAVYAQRACLDTLIIERSTVSGGQILNTYEVDNYPGYPGISGYELGMKLREHADHLGAQFKEDTVLKIEDKGLENLKQVIGMNENYEARTLILATGAVHKKLGIPGEKELTGAGVSYCATCDGAFFRNRTVAVIGGGDVAVEDAIFLSRMCSKVYLIHRRGKLRAAKSLQNQLFSKGNVVILWNTEAEAIKGDGAVESLLLQDHVTGEKKEISLQGVFSIYYRRAYLGELLNNIEICCFHPFQFPVSSLCHRFPSYCGLLQFPMSCEVWKLSILLWYY